jgi:hypothetical protein
LAVDDEVDDDAPGELNRSLDAAFIVNLLTALGKLDTLGAPSLRDAAARKIAARPAVFDPVEVVVPALGILRAEPRKGGSVRDDGAVDHLWTQSADFLLRRSEFPPEPPKDWRQDAALSCHCVDCRELQAFMQDPAERVHRFRVRKDRRQHLHNMIEWHALDMNHVTERKGSPQTLVCTKDRRSYQRRCKQYRQDIAALATLAGLMGETGTDHARWQQRINAARARSESGSPE